MEFSRRVDSFFGLELRVELQKSSRFSAMPSELDIAKRGLVKVLKEGESNQRRVLVLGKHPEIPQGDSSFDTTLFIWSSP